jgi:5-methylthioadenosine/S-adenosylhomocysteine deaminase
MAPAPAPSPAAIDLLVLPRWLVPMEPLNTVVEQAALAIDGGRILEILPVSAAQARYAPRETLELPQHAILPGLVNAHTHAAMSLLRGLADDLPLMDWLQGHIWPAEGAHVSEAFCADGVGLACAEMIRSGTTCFNDMYFYPDTTARVASAAGLRSVVGLIVLDFPSVWARDADEYIHKGREVHDALKGQPLVRTVFAPHAPYTVSDAPLRKLRIFANELGIGVHMTQLSEDEIREAGEYRISVIHCPESNLKLASGFCPVHALQQAGVNIALGTDGAASNNDLDLLGELRTAALLAKGVAQDARALSAPQALHAATLGGARALGLEQEIGSLVPGKSADFIAVDLSGVSTQPLYNVISQLVYAAGREQISDVYVSGRALMRNRRLLTLDEPELLARAAHWRARVRP